MGSRSWTPNAIQIVSGNNQTAAPGNSFAQPLVVQVVDASSPPIPVVGVPVSWAVSPANALLVVPASLTTGSYGQVSATVTLSYHAAGPVLVTATVPNGKPVTFSLSEVPGLIRFSGDNQSAAVGLPFQHPVEVQVVVGPGQSPGGILVNFAVTSGPATLTQSTATTDVNGIAVVGVIAGNTTGAVTIIANVGMSAVTFHLTVTLPGFRL
jgi:hypothetical protein